MTLDEAIQHSKEVSINKRRRFEDIYGQESVTAEERTEGIACLDCSEEHAQLASWLEELKARREADRWIPVSERLPEKWQGVLAYDNNDVFVAWRIDNAWNSSDSQFDKNTPIIAWRSLPGAYKESEATNETDN